MGNYFSRPSWSPLRRPLIQPGTGLNTYVDPGTGITVTFTEQSAPRLESVRADNKLSDYLRTINREEIRVEDVQVTEVSMFGPRVGFVYITVTAYSVKTGNPVPGVVLVTGPSVAIIVVATIPGIKERQVVVVNQLRVPAGRSVIEAPAGMVDGKTNKPAGVALKELEQETGLKIPSVEDLISLGDTTPSIGRLNEKIKLYGLVTTITRENFEQMKTAEYGVAKENESIRVDFIPLDSNVWDVVEQTGDPKLEIGLRRFLERESRGVMGC